MSHDVITIAGILMVPLITFCVFVAPVWIFFHYRAAARRDLTPKSAPTSPEDQEMMARMIGLLEKMEGRMATMEKILDADDPKWREKQTFRERA